MSAAACESIDAAVASYERLWRPVAEEKQRACRAAARWFLPATTGQLHVRRAALRLARLPVLDRAVGAIVGGKPSVVVKAVRAEPR